MSMKKRSALMAFIVKETHHILRDRQTLMILLLLPLIQVILFGYALRNEVAAIRVVMVVPQADYATEALRNRFSWNNQFEVVSVARDLGPAEQLFRRDEADLALVFESGFGDRLAAGGQVPLLIIGDVSDPNTGTRMQSYASLVISEYQRELNRQAGQMIQPVTIVPQLRMRFNPTLESVNLFVPGLIAMILTLVSALMTTISLSREKERGTVEVLLVSPLRPWQIIVGKVSPYMLLGFANVVTVLLAAFFIFRVPFQGSLLLLLSASAIYIMVGLALGVLIAAVATSQRAAMLGALLGTMLPNALLSGLIFPIASFPAWLQPVTYIVPARWFIVISRGVMLKGIGLTYLWQEVAILCLMLVVLMMAAVWAFRPRLA